MAPAHPGFFRILALPRAYTTAAFLLLSLASGVALFSFAVTGLSLGLGLAVLVVGLPYLVGFLFLTRLLAALELRLLRLMVDPEGLEAPAFLPLGDGILGRSKALLVDRRTWTSLAYFVLLLPFGMAAFSLLTVLFSVAAALLAAPLVALASGPGSVHFDGLGWFQAHPWAGLALGSVLGALLLPAAFHAALLLGRLRCRMASALLVR